MAAFYISKDRPARTLLIFAILGLTAMLIGLFTTGKVAIYSVFSGVICSIMWPAIFNVSIFRSGKYTTQGSAFLIMMILGGGIIPHSGKMADHIQLKSSIVGYGIHQSYWVPVFCFAYLAFLGFAVKGILKKQGID